MQGAVIKIFCSSQILLDLFFCSRHVVQNFLLEYVLVVIRASLLQAFFKPSITFMYKVRQFFKVPNLTVFCEQHFSRLIQVKKCYQQASKFVWQVVFLIKLCFLSKRKVISGNSNHYSMFTEQKKNSSTILDIIIRNFATFQDNLNSPQLQWYLIFSIKTFHTSCHKSCHTS